MDFCETLKKSKKKDFTRNRKLPLEQQFSLWKRIKNQIDKSEL